MSVALGLLGVAACLISGIALQGAAGAAPAKNTFHLANWSGGAYSDPRSKSFEYCAAAKSSPEKTGITYSVDRSYHWGVTLSDPQWSFLKGATQNASLKIDDAPPMAATVVALGPNKLSIRPRDGLLFFARLRVAQQMRVALGGLVLKFSLIEGGEALSALTQCVLHSTHFSQRTKSSKALLTVDGVAKTAHNKEAVALASDIIGQMRVAKSELLTKLEDALDFPADAMWKAGLVVGRLLILDTPIPMPRVSDAVIARSLEGCQGGFFFNKASEEISGSAIERVFASCQTPDTTMSSYHLVVPRPKSGYYILSVVSSGSAFIRVAHKAANEYEARLYSIIMPIVQRQARSVSR
jgi:hypothetical protein